VKRFLLVQLGVVFLETEIHHLQALQSLRVDRMLMVRNLLASLWKTVIVMLVTNFRLFIVFDFDVEKKVAPNGSKDFLYDWVNTDKHTSCDTIDMIWLHGAW
jgi:hypothetical protein